MYFFLNLQKKYRVSTTMRCFVTVSGQETVKHVTHCKSLKLHNSVSHFLQLYNNVSMNVLFILLEDCKVALSAKFKMAISTLKFKIYLEQATLIQPCALYHLEWSLKPWSCSIADAHTDSCIHLLVIMIPSCFYYAAFLVRGSPHGGRHSVHEQWIICRYSLHVLLNFQLLAL